MGLVMRLALARRSRPQIRTSFTPGSRKGHRMRVRLIGAAAAAVVAAGVRIAAPAGAAPGGPPGGVPASWTPQIATSGTDGSVEQIRHLAQCGSTMYAVGRFTQVKK